LFKHISTEEKYITKKTTKENYEPLKAVKLELEVDDYTFNHDQDRYKT
jgi:hypothetical protein